MKLDQLRQYDFRLTTDRLVLEPIDIQHAGQLFPFMKDPNTSQFLAWSSHPNAAFSQQVVESLCSNHRACKAFHWSIYFNSKICGLISLIDIKEKHLSWTLNRSELAYWIAGEQHGKGLATESSRRVMSFAFNDCNFHKVIVAHASENLASAKVIDKLGFRFLCEEKQAFNKDRCWHNLKHYELLQSEYRDKE